MFCSIQHVDTVEQLVTPIHTHAHLLSDQYPDDTASLLIWCSGYAFRHMDEVTLY